MIMTLIGFLISIYDGAVMYRLRGSANHFIKPVLQALFCVIYPLVLQSYDVNPYLNGAGYLMSILFCCSGHGQWQSLNKWLYAMKAEKLDFIVRIFFGRDPRTAKEFSHLVDKSFFEYYPDEIAAIETAVSQYGLTRLYWRGVFGMAISGISISLFPGIALYAEGFHYAGVALILSGAMKGYAAEAGWRYYNNTESGEQLTGGYLWGTAFLIAKLIRF